MVNFIKVNNSFFYKAIEASSYNITERDNSLNIILNKVNKY